MSHAHLSARRPHPLAWTVRSSQISIDGDFTRDRGSEGAWGLDQPPVPFAQLAGEATRLHWEITTKIEVSVPACG